jgi:hypothetical protein
LFAKNNKIGIPFDALLNLIMILYDYPYFVIEEGSFPLPSALADGQRDHINIRGFSPIMKSLPLRCHQMYLP